MRPFGSAVRAGFPGQAHPVVLDQFSALFARQLQVFRFLDHADIDSGVVQGLHALQVGDISPTRQTPTVCLFFKSIEGAIKQDEIALLLERDI